MDPVTGLPSSRRSTLSGGETREGIFIETRDWTSIKAIELVADQNVVIIDGDTPIEEACDKLIEYNISSAPVYDSSTKSFVGVFDWADVMSYLLIVLKKKNAAEQQRKSEEQLSSEFKDLIKLAIQCQPVPVKLASDLSNKSPFLSVLPETPLFQIVESFGSGIHRVAIVDADGNLKGMLSQSRVISYLYENVSHFPQIEALFPKKVRDLELGRTQAVCAQANSFVLDALTMMSKGSLSSIGITDEDGMLIGNVSMSDVKYVLRSYRHSLLWKTCHQFVSHVRSRQGLDDGQDRYPVFDISPTSTLGYSIAKLTATKAHRVWVVDERMNPIGVVSMTDVLSVFAKEAGGKPNPLARRQRSLSAAMEISGTSIV